MSLREAFEKQAGTYQFKEVDIGGGVKVWVRTLSGPERQEYDTKLLKVNKKDPRKVEFLHSKQKGLLVSATLLAGDPPNLDLMYKSPDELLSVIKDSSILDKLFEASGGINGIVENDDEDKEAGKG